MKLKILKLPKYVLIQLKLYFRWLLFKISKNWVILNRIHRSVRPAIWRLTGCRVGKNVSIGYDVYFDVGNSNLIHIENDVWITSRCIILCHMRDLSSYYVGCNINQQTYIKKAVHIKRGAHIGMGSIILPGVVVGEGAIIGAGSIVTKDVTPWTVVAGNPAKAIRNIPAR